MRKTLLTLMALSLLFVAAVGYSEIIVKSSGGVIVNDVEADMTSPAVLGGMLHDTYNANQYGYNSDVDASSAEDVWSYDGTINYPDSATQTLYVSSTDSATTAAVRIVGLDEDWLLEVGEATLSGQTAVQIGENTSSLVTNGNFATTGSWTLDTGWTISAGTLNLSTGGAEDEDASQAVTITSGKDYRLTFDIDSISSTSLVSIDTYLGDVEIGTGDHAVGSNAINFTATEGGSLDLVFRADVTATATAAIDDVILYDIDNWYWRRIFAAEVTGSIADAGDIYVSMSDSVTAGVPDTSTDVVAKIPSGARGAQISAYTVPDGARGLLLGWGGSVGVTTGTTVFTLQSRENGHLWIDKATHVVPAGGGFYKELSTPHLFQEKTDIKIEVDTETDNEKAAAELYILVVED